MVQFPGFRGISHDLDKLSNGAEGQEIFQIEGYIVQSCWLSVDCDSKGMNLSRESGAVLPALKSDC